MPLYNVIVIHDIAQIPRTVAYVQLSVLFAFGAGILYTLAAEVDGTNTLLVLTLMTAVGFYVFTHFFLARAFGVDSPLAVLLANIPIIGLPYLAFGNVNYIFAVADHPPSQTKLAPDTLLRIDDLKVYFPIRNNNILGGTKSYVRAVDGISLDLKRGETLGLVGESGSGKTSVGRAILRAINPTGGDVIFRGNGKSYTLAVDQNVPDSYRDIVQHALPAVFHETAIDNYKRNLPRLEIQKARPLMQMIFQDPYASLNPRMPVRDIIAEPLIANKLVKGNEVNQRVQDIAKRAKLNIEHLRRFPHAFSGGQRQRVGIARALVSNPEFIVCDESVSALDVSIQAEILNLLMDLQEEFGLTYLFIAHDLSVVAHISDRVAVMYVGQIVELAATEDLFKNPMHPYTAALLSAIPEVDPDAVMKPVSLAGEIPNPANPPNGCRFHTRCHFAKDICRTTVPEWKEHSPAHFAACHFVGDLDLQGIEVIAKAEPT